MQSKTADGDVTEDIRTTLRPFWSSTSNGISTNVEPVAGTEEWHVLLFTTRSKSKVSGAERRTETL